MGSLNAVLVGINEHEEARWGRRFNGGKFSVIGNIQGGDIAMDGPAHIVTAVARHAGEGCAAGRIPDPGPITRAAVDSSTFIVIPQQTLPDGGISHLGLSIAPAPGIEISGWRKDGPVEYKVVGRQIVAIVIGIQDPSQRQLPEIAAAFRGESPLLGQGKGRNQHGGQYGYDGYDNKHLNQSETIPTGPPEVGQARMNSP